MRHVLYTRISFAKLCFIFSTGDYNLDFENDVQIVRIWRSVVRYGVHTVLYGRPILTYGVHLVPYSVLWYHMASNDEI